MQLAFPNGESASVPLQTGNTTMGSHPDSAICLAGVGLAPNHALFELDRRGLWLRVLSDAGRVHVNARPVKELALLRPGDQICLGALVAVVLEETASAVETNIPGSSPASLRGREQADVSRAVLRAVSGPCFGRSFGLGSSPVLGRSHSSDIRIDAPGVADRHARIELHGELIVLRTLASDSTTQVNGVEVRDALLAPGDQLLIGSHRFVLEAPGMLRRENALGSVPDRHVLTTPAAAESKIMASAAMETRQSTVSGSLWWLIAAAALLAASATVVLIYAPRLG